MSDLAFIDYIEGIKEVADGRVNTIKELLDILEAFQLFGQLEIAVGWKDKFDSCVEAEFDEDCLDEPFPPHYDDDYASYS